MLWQNIPLIYDWGESLAAAYSLPIFRLASTNTHIKFGKTKKHLQSKP